MRKIFSDYPTSVQQLIAKTEDHILKLIPVFVIKEYPGWKGIGFIHPRAGYVCGIFPQKDHIRLLFEHGSLLQDEGFFTGGGSKTRFRTVYPGDKIPQLEYMLVQAIEAVTI